jgi:DsbC/DsbD-like thiol-disulfide interchange protein
MSTRIFLVFAALSTLASASGQPGRAAVAWIGGSATCEPGRPYQTAVRMVLDAGWHSYWINPGKAGMKTTIEWKLPPGWKGGELQHPAPEQFQSAGLTGFGYEGTVWLPVTVTPPADFTGTARLTAVISWMACGVDGCVPGEAELQLDLHAGPPERNADAPAIDAALAQVPRPHPAAPRLVVRESGKTIMLEIIAEPDFPVDLGPYRVFPATPESIDPKANIRFSKKGAIWTAAAPKSEYADGPLRELALVLVGDATTPPIEMVWRAAEK